MINLNTLHGEVHRLTGIIDRMGQRPGKEEQKNLTICIRSLRLAATGESINPDHCWLPLRQELADLNLQPGDEIAFTTKIHRIKKGYQPSGYTPEGKHQSPQRTAFGPGRELRDVSIVKRARRLDQSPQVIEERLTTQLEVERQEHEQLLKVVEALDTELATLNHLKHEHRQLEEIIAQKDTELRTLKHEHPQLEETIAQLEGRVQSSLPRQQALSAVFLSAFFCLITGFGLGASTSHASR